MRGYSFVHCTLGAIIFSSYVASMKNASAEPTITPHPTPCSRDYFPGSQLFNLKEVISTSVNQPSGLDFSKNNILISKDRLSPSSDNFFVYLNSDNFCGTGGCRMLILMYKNNKYNLINSVFGVRLPIVSFNTRHNGWRDIGIQSYSPKRDLNFTRLLFDGSRYPSNPTLPHNVTVGHKDDIYKILISNEPQDSTRQCRIE